MNDTQERPISVLWWMLILVITAIPIVGQIMIVVLAFSGGNPTTRNYFRAILVWMLIFIALAIVMVTSSKDNPIERIWDRVRNGPATTAATR